MTTTTITTYTWDGLTSSFTTNDNSSSGYITYNTNGDVVEQFTDYGGGSTIQVNNQYNSYNQLTQAIYNSGGISESIYNYTWDGLTSSWTVLNNPLSGYTTYNTNGDIVENFIDYGGPTSTQIYQYDSDNRLIQTAVTYSDDWMPGWVTNYTWDGLTANFVTSGGMTYSGYQIMNVNDYIVELYSNTGTTESTSTYEYNCNTSTLLDLNKSKTLLFTINLIGQETVQKGFNIEIYDDGSVEKKYVIK